MKSRVARNRDLYERLNQTVDEKIENRDLSSFANRLNSLDTQFEKMDIEESLDYLPSHARSQEEPVFETFENEYLKDFLEEVKEYNVQKGYRSHSDTTSNILNEITDVHGSSKEVNTSRVHLHRNVDVSYEDTLENLALPVENSVSSVSIAEEIQMLTQDLNFDISSDVEPELDAIVSDLTEAAVSSHDHELNTLIDGNVLKKEVSESEVEFVVEDEIDFKEIRKNRLVNSFITLAFIVIFVVAAYLVKMIWFN